MFKILGLSTTLIILVMWACLPFYWGSSEFRSGSPNPNLPVGIQLKVRTHAVWKANRYTNKLTVRVINYDEGAIGSFISSALVSRDEDTTRQGPLRQPVGSNASGTEMCSAEPDQSWLLLHVAERVSNQRRCRE